MKAKKGQVSLEFLVYSSIFLLVFIILAFVFSDMSRTETSKNDYIMASIIGNKLLVFMATAHSIGPEFRSSFDLPSNINGYSYNITIYRNDEGNNFVLVNVKDSFNTYYSGKAMNLGIEDDVVLFPAKKVYVNMGKEGLSISQDYQNGVCQ